MRTRLLSLLFFPALAACTTTTEPSATEEDRGSLGKADLVGSCEHKNKDLCGGKGTGNVLGTAFPAPGSVAARPAAKGSGTVLGTVFPAPGNTATPAPKGTGGVLDGVLNGAGNLAAVVVCGVARSDCVSQRSRLRSPRRHQRVFDSPFRNASRCRCGQRLPGESSVIAS